MRIERTDGGAVIYKERGKPLRILQLTDIHLGCGLLCRRNDKLALSAVEKIVRAAEADFCVITGDVGYPFVTLGGSHDNLKPFRMVGDLLAKYHLPWCAVFGNHDTEPHARYQKEQLADYMISRPDCYFAKGEAGLTGCGNYCIPLKGEDGKDILALMFVDSNAYVGKSFFSGFDIIHQDQVDWYVKTIKDMSEDVERPLPSLAFFHIPPKEIKTAWDHIYRGETDDATYHLGFVQEKDNYFGYPKTLEGTFFAEMVKLGSCKGMFFGHDHLNTLSATYRGIRMTYGMSIDYFAYPHMLEKHTQRGGTIIEIYDDATFDVKLLPLDDLQ
ncbi:MAG: metallophosphoesterase [Clostridia bacterium]|nr:metallophosphoesterase [Clostridia bacterium]